MTQSLLWKGERSCQTTTIMLLFFWGELSQTILVLFWNQERGSNKMWETWGDYHNVFTNVFNLWTRLWIHQRPISQSNPTLSKLQPQRGAIVKKERNWHLEKKAVVKVQLRTAGETLDNYFGCIPLLSLLVLCCFHKDWQRDSVQSSKTKTFASLSAAQKCLCVALGWKSDSRSVFNETWYALLFSQHQ